MRPLIKNVASASSTESIASCLSHLPGFIFLHSSQRDVAQARYSFLVAEPFLTFRSFGSRAEISQGTTAEIQYGDPWKLLDSLMSRYELLDELDLPFPLGGCFGYWGYDLKNFVEPKLPRRALNDLELPDCVIGFYDSLVVFDHALGKSWVISTGLSADGSRDESRAQAQAAVWEERLSRSTEEIGAHVSKRAHSRLDANVVDQAHSNLTAQQFIDRVQTCQRYIRSGDIYQANLAQRLMLPLACAPWDLFERLTNLSPAPFSAFINCGDFQIASASPEQFLRLSGPHIRTRPIKGTRPRSSDSTRDTQLAYELQTSQKEMAELVMITDLLRNDLGRVCEFGSVNVPELVRLERFSHVQHLVSTVEGRLRHGITHFDALASCFPGGSVTGAPKIRAMEIIDKLEPVTRGPYTGAIGYIGFNRESQLSIAIRTAVCKDNCAWLHVGAGIVADSIPKAEYEETLAKASGYLHAINCLLPVEHDRIH
jgi:para-aminobenzoate synthetase component 1